MGAIKEVVNPILGNPKWKLSEGRATLFYKFQPEEHPETTAKLKIEINTRGHFSVLGFTTKHFSMTNRWLTGKIEIQTYHFNELLSTKLRTLTFFFGVFQIILSTPGVLAPRFTVTRFTAM